MAFGQIRREELDGKSQNQRMANALMEVGGSELPPSATINGLKPSENKMRWWGGVGPSMTREEVLAVQPTLSRAGEFMVNGLNAEVRFVNDEVVGLTVNQLPPFDDALVDSLKQHFGKVSSLRCDLGKCQAVWQLQDGYAAYLINNGKLVFQSADAP